MADGKKTVTVYNKGKGWIRNPDGTGGERPGTTVTNLLSSLGTRTFRQVFRLTDPGVRLSALEDAKVGDRSASVIKLERGTGGEMRFFIDKENGRLLKSESVSQMANGNDDFYSSLYEDYREASGIMVAHKRITLHNGEVTAEGEVIEYKIVDKLDDKLFEQP